MNEKIKALASKKVAGIPVMALAAIFMVAILYYAIKMRATPESLPEDATDTGEDLAGDVDSGDQPTFQASPALVGSVTAGTVTAVQTEDTNELWAKRVSEWLRSQGYTYDEVQGMLSRFLAGDSLTVRQDQMREKAIDHYGEPPEPVDYAPVTPNAPKPSTPPKNPSTGYPGPPSRQGTPPLTHRVKGKGDDTAVELARLYYPSKVPAQGRRLILGANGSLHEPFKIGTLVRVPAWHDPKYYRATSATRTAVAIASKNGISVDRVRDMNPGLHFPVQPGRRVRVG